MVRSLSALALASLAIAAHAQTVPLQKYRLGNGMTVILAPDHSSPRVTINTWFRVGSKDEPERRSGFAHLFEHLMFMGTNRVPNGQFDKIMEGLGGQNNASTGTDRTNYYSSGPSHILKTLLWLDADRLQDLGKAMDKKKVDLQREVVRNERRQSIEQQPYGKAYEAMPGLMYPVNHPYHNSVIGSHEDLQAASVEDVQKFFATYYVPSNASLVVSGDFDPTEAKAYIDQVFGTLPRGNDVVRKDVPQVGWQGTKRVTMTDTVQFPKVILSWHSPAAFQPGEAAVRVAADILGKGVSSRLYEELVTKQGLANEVSVYQDSELLGSTFTVDATAAPEVPADKLRAAIDKVLAEFVSQGPVESELRKVVADTERGIYRALQDVGEKADLLNSYEYYLGEPDSFKRVLDEYRALTPQAVKQAAVQVLTPNRLELTVVPELPAPKQDPRDKQPEVGAVQAWTPATPVEFEALPGVKVSYWYRPEVPLTDIRWVFKGGASLDATDKLGLATLSADMLERGTEGLTGSEFESTLAQAGASLDASADLRTTTVHLNTLSSSFPATLKLAVSAMKAPGLLPAEFESLKRERKASIQALADDPVRLARQLISREYYGAEHPAGRPTSGKVDTVDKVSVEDVKGYLSNVVRPAGMRVFASGSLPPEEFRQQLATAMANWRENRMAPLLMPTLPKPSGEDASFRVVFLDKPGAAQTVINWIAPGESLSSPDRLALTAIGEVMGGSFTSRLNQNLREDKGYTYGVGGGFSFEKEYGTFSVRTSVRTDVTGAALAEVLKELQAAAKGNFSPAEATKAVSLGRASQIDRLATMEGTVSAAVAQYELGRSLAEIGSDLAAASTLKEANLNKLAGRLGKLDHGVLLLVGDREKVLPQLKGLGLPEPVVIHP